MNYLMHQMMFIFLLIISHVCYQSYLMLGKDTPIHMQILFNVLMGLRCSEINAVKYSDVDYINRTLKVQ